MGYVVIYTVVNNVVFVGVSENGQYAPKRYTYIYIIIYILYNYIHIVMLI